MIKPAQTQLTALGGEVWGKPGVAGVYTNQRLSLSKLWEGPRMTCQGFKPDSGNPTVRHYRGASGTVRHGETVTPFRNRKSGNGNPSPTARRARFLSRPSSTIHSMAPRCLVRRPPPHHELSIHHPGQNSNLATACLSAADLLPRLRPIHAQCQHLTHAAQQSASS